MHRDRESDWRTAPRVVFGRASMSGPLVTELQATLNLIPANTCYAAPSGDLTFGLMHSPAR